MTATKSESTKTPDLDFEGSVRGTKYPIAQLRNDENYGLVFIDEPDENMAALAGITTGLQVSLKFSGNKNRRQAVLLRQPTLAIIKAVQTVEWIVPGGRYKQVARKVYFGKPIFTDPGYEKEVAKCDQENTLYSLLPPQSHMAEVKFTSKYFAVITSEAGDIISNPFHLSLKGSAKSSWNLAMWGGKPGKYEIFLPQNLSLDQFDTDCQPGFEYIGGAPGTDGLSIPKGYQSVLQERLRIHRNEPEGWKPTNLARTRACMLFRPVFTQAEVGTEPGKKKNAVLVVGFRVPTQENLGKGFIPTSVYNDKIHELLQEAEIWEKSLDRAPMKRQSNKAIDISSWGDGWADDWADDIEEAPAVAAPAPSGAPWAGNEPLF